MAKKKKRSRSRSRKGKRKSKRSGPKSKPLGLTAGVGVTSYELTMRSTPTGMTSPLQRLIDGLTGKSPLADTPEYVVERLVANAADIPRYKGAAVGVIVSSATKIPLVKILAKPADKGIRDLTKGKWRL